MRSIRAVFVDVDNTLYDFEASLMRTLSGLHAEFRTDLGVGIAEFEAAYWGAANAVPDPDGVLRRGLDEWRRACLSGTLDRLGVPQDGLVPRLVEAFNRHRTAAFIPFPGAVEALQHIARDRTLGVITNGPSGLQREKLRAFGILAFVRPDLVLVSGELPWQKPAPEIFLEAARRAGARPDECLMVGDSERHDMPAAAVGFRTVYVNPKGMPVPAMEHGPHAVIETPAALPQVLGRL